MRSKRWPGPENEVDVPSAQIPTPPIILCALQEVVCQFNMAPASAEKKQKETTKETNKEVAKDKNAPKKEEEPELV